MSNIFSNLKNKLFRASNKIKIKSKTRRFVSFNEEKTSFGSKIINFFKDKSRMGIALIFILIAIFCLYQIIIDVKAFADFKPKSFPGSSKTVKNEWNGSEKLTILFIGGDETSKEHLFVDHLSLYSYDPRENNLSVFILNPDIKVSQSTIGYSLNYRTILNNRKIDEDNLAILIKSVENLLALKIDRYVLVKKADFPNISQYFNSLQINVPKNINDPDTIEFNGKQSIGWSAGSQVVLPINYLDFVASDSNGRDDQFNRQQILLESLTMNLLGFRSVLNFSNILKEFENNAYTDMGKYEILNLGIKLLNLKPDDIKKGYLREYAYSPIIDVGFYEQVSPDISQIDKDLSNIFFDLKVFKEQARIEVLNASGVRGLANNRARWIKNIGARVIQVGNAFESEEFNVIYCDDPEKYEVTIKELRRFLGKDVKIINEKYHNRHIGDIVLVLGKNYE